MSEKATKSLFDGIQTKLSEEGFNVQLIPVNENNPVEQCLVYLGKDNDSPIIQMIFMNDMLKTSNFSSLNENPKTDILQFFSPFQIEVKNERNLDVYNLLSVFSRIIPIGYFGLSSEGVFYRYSQMIESGKVSSEVISEVVGIINFFVNDLFIKVKSLCEGEKTLEQILNETDKELIKKVS
jgi:hypothetical protein